MGDIQSQSQLVQKTFMQENQQHCASLKRDKFKHV